MYGEMQRTDADAEHAGRPVSSRGYLPPQPAGRIVSITPGTIWLVVGIIATLAIIAYIVARATEVFILLFIAIIFAEAIRPIMSWLRRRGVPRPLGVLLIYTGIVALLGFLAWLLINPLVAQVATLQRNLPQYMRIAGDYVAQIQTLMGDNPEVARALTQLEGQLGSLATDILKWVLAIPLAVLLILGGGIAVASMAFFWLTGTDHLEPFVIGLFPAEAQPQVHEVFADIGTRLSGYVQGVVINMFAIGILSGLGIYFLGVPYAILLGIVAGLFEMLPYVGPWISGFITVVVALISGGTIKAVEVGILFILIQEIEGNTLVPQVMHRVVRLNPLVVIVAVLAGGVLYGIVGATLAVPVAAVVQVVVERVLAPAARDAAAHIASSTATPSSHPHDGVTSPGAQDGTTVPTV